MTRKNNSTAFFAVDCEYAQPVMHEIMINNSIKNFIKYQVVDTGVYGEIDGKEYYRLFENTNLIDAMKSVIEQFPDFKTYVFYSFFSTAELSTISVYDIVNAGFTIKRLYRSMRGYNLELNYKLNGSNKVVKIVDARILTTIENLESLVTLFAPDVPNPKEFRRQIFGTEDVDDNFYLQMTREQRWQYNYLDCRGLYVAVKNFKSKMIELIKQIFNIDISPSIDKIETLGGFAKYVIKKLDKHGLLKSYSDVVNEKGKAREIDPNIKEFYKIGWNLYRGGGLIINYAPLLQKSKHFKNVKLYDVKSLYPLSGILASHFLAGFEYGKFIYKFGLDAVQFIKSFDVRKYGGYVYIGLKFNGGINGKPFVGYRKIAKSVIDNNTDDMENYRIYYTKIVPPQWYTLQELKFILTHGYEIDTSIDINHVKLYAWQVDERLISENPLYVYFASLLEYRLKQTDEIMSKLVKMLLNIAYGKIAQHKNQTKNSVIVNPIVAGYLTSISRLIMYHFVSIAIHMATDSVFTHQDIDENVYKSKIENTLKVKFPSFYTTFLSFEKSGNVFIYKCKSYLFEHNDGNYKVAHHGLRLRGKKNIVKFFETVKLLKPNVPIVFEIIRHNWYSFDIVNHWISLKTEKLVLNPNVLNEIQKLQQLIFRPMIETQLHLKSADFIFKLKSFDWTTHEIDDNYLFETVEDCEKHMLMIERQKLRIKNKISKDGNNGKNKDTKQKMRLIPSLQCYENKVEIIKIDCR
jgi:hypothetical protein